PRRDGRASAGRGRDPSRRARRRVVPEARDLGRAQRRVRRRLRRARRAAPGAARRGARSRPLAAAGVRLQRPARVVRRGRVVIEPERLALRVRRAHGRVQMLAWWSDPPNERSEPGADPVQVRRWAYGVPWGVWERGTGELVGDASLHFDTTFGDWE